MSITKLQNISATTNENKVAIIAFACNFPGNVKSLDDLWQVLLNRESCIKDIPNTRFNINKYYSPLKNTKGHSYVNKAGIVDDILDFDKDFFSMSSRESQTIDPEQKVILELVYKALEQAYIKTDAIKGSSTGVYIGAGSPEFSLYSGDDIYRLNSYSMLGTSSSIISNRVSYFYDLHGPSMTIDTACSSSLVAINEAFNYVIQNKDSMAIAGGVNIILTPFPFVGFSHANMLSPDGQCYVFDERANGYVRSEGGAIIILKNLAKAIEDNDNILAVIEASKVNSDGRTQGISLPNEESQKGLLKDLYNEDYINRLVYIEAHGTGTKVGDPIELNSIGSVLGSKFNELKGKDLTVGSIKGNLGHLETASGMAGLARALLILKHGKIPVIGNFKNCNKDIDFQKLHLKINTNIEDIDPIQNPIIGINSFGFGGTNAHLLISRYDKGIFSKDNLQDPQNINIEDNLPPFCISAKSENSLKALALQYANYLNISNVYSSIVNNIYLKDRFDKTLLIDAKNCEELKKSLIEFANDKEIDNAYLFDSNNESKRICLVFSGNGCQYASMGQELYKENKIFKDCIDEIDNILKNYQDWSLVSYINQDAKQWDLSQTQYAQVILFAIEVALTKYLQSLGLHVFACVGHSVGEVAACYIANKISLKDACCIIYERSYLQSRLHNKGSMAAVKVKKDTLDKLLENDLFKDVEIAAINSVNSFTLSGSSIGIDNFITYVKKHKEFSCSARKLDILYPFHSKLMSEIEFDVKNSLSHIQTLDSDINFISTVTGKLFCKDNFKLDGNYWWLNIKNCVLFKNSIEQALDLGANLFVEIGSNSILTNYVKQIIKDNKCKASVLTSLKKGSDDNLSLKKLTFNLIKENVELDTIYKKDKIDVTLELPSYIFDKKYNILPSTNESSFLYNYNESDSYYLGHKSTPNINVFLNELDEFKYKSLSGHRINNKAIMPAALYIEMMFSSYKQAFSKSYPHLVNVSIERAIELDSIKRVKTSIEGLNKVIISSRNLGDDDFIENAKSRFELLGSYEYKKLDSTLLTKGIEFNVDAFYQKASHVGFDYLDNFRVINNIRLLDENSVLLSFNDVQRTKNVALDIETLDGALQSILVFDKKLSSFFDDRYLLLPSFVDRVSLCKESKVSYAFCTLKKIAKRSVVLDLMLYDKNLDLCVMVQNVRYRQVKSNDTSTKVLSHLDFIKTKSLYPHALVLNSNFELNKLTLSSSSIQMREDNDALYIALILSYIKEVFYDLNTKEKYVETIFGFSIDDRYLGFANFLLSLLCQYEFAHKEGCEYYLHDINLPAPIDIFNLIYKEKELNIAKLLLVDKIGSSLKDILQGNISFGVNEYKKFITQYIMSNEDILYFQNYLKKSLKDVKDNTNKETLNILIYQGTETYFIDYLEELILDRDLYVNYLVDDNYYESYKEKYVKYDNVKIKKKSDIYSLNDMFDVIYLVTFNSTDVDIPKLIQKSTELLVDNAYLFAFDFINNNLNNFIYGFFENFFSYDEDIAVSYSHLLSIENLDNIINKELFNILDLTNLGSIVFVSLQKKKVEKTYEISINNDFIQDIQDDFVVIKDNNLTFKQEDFQDKSKVLVSLLDFDKLDDCDSISLINKINEFIISLQDIKVSQHLHIVFLVNDVYAKNNCVDINSFAYAFMSYIQVCRNEFSHISFKLISIDSLLGCSKNALINEINDEKDSEIHLSLINRYKTCLLDDVNVDKHKDHAKFLDLNKSSKISSLTYKDVVLHDLSNNEILIKVEATALNYRDVLWAQGMLPDEALEQGFSGDSLGLECSGIVLKTGNDVLDFKVGDSVIALSKACFSDLIYTKESAVIKKPDNLTFEEAASIPVIFITAYYAICKKAQACNGESILIHGACGGVGLAAIEIAKYLNLEIYATAGSDEKRKLLKNLGVKHIYDSRSADFASAILEDTNNEGVDIVLNSLYGDLMLASLSLLKPFGRFLELGKRDFYNDNSLYLRKFRDNISYFGIDVDELLIYKDKYANEIFKELISHFTQGHFNVIPYRVYDKECVKRAFLDMKGSSHIGKIVVRNNYTKEMAYNFLNNITEDKFSKTHISKNIKADKAYIITGGFGGLGFEIAKYLSSFKCDLIIIGRRKEDDSLKAKREILEKNGSCVHYLSLDISNKEELFVNLDNLSLTSKIDGFIHTAVSLDDRLIVNQDKDSFNHVFKAKVLGAKNFASYFDTRNLHLNFEYYLSSITTIFGNAGQANYVFSNAYLESFTLNRFRQNKNAHVFLLGAIKDVGLLKDKDIILKTFENTLGAPAITSHDVIQALFTSPINKAMSSIYFVNYKKLAKLNSFKANRFDEIRYLSPSDNLDKSCLRDELVGLSEDKAINLIETRIKIYLAQIMEINTNNIKSTMTIGDIGMDSLMLMELISILENDLDKKIPMNIISAKSSIYELSESLYALISNKDSSDDLLLKAIETSHGVDLKEIEG